MIYFIQAEDGPIKIGFTASVISRLKSLQISSSKKLKIIGAMPGDRHKEMELHKRFKNIRLASEWFKPCKLLIDFINSLPKEYINTIYDKPPNDLEARLGKDVETIRLSKNVTRQSLCKTAGVSENALRHLEGGKGATVKTLVKIAEALGKKDWLLSFAPIISINPLYMVRGRARRRARNK